MRPLVYSKAPVNKLVNAEVNRGSRKAVVALNYAAGIRGRHAALRESIVYKVICLTRKTIKLHMHSDPFLYAKKRKGPVIGTLRIPTATPTKTSLENIRLRYLY